MSCTMRSRAPDVAGPLPRNGEAARSSRMALSRSGSRIFGFVPRLRESIGVTLARALARTAYIVESGNFSTRGATTILPRGPH